MVCRHSCTKGGYTSRWRMVRGCGARRHVSSACIRESMAPAPGAPSREPVTLRLIPLCVLALLAPEPLVQRTVPREDLHIAARLGERNPFREQLLPTELGVAAPALHTVRSRVVRTEHGGE